MKLDTLEDWIIQHIQTNTLLTNDTILIDIGAYHGDFTQRMFLNSQIDNAILFEPNNNNYCTLKSIFSNNSSVEIQHCALGDSEATIDFYCDSDLATGSVLRYQHSHDDLSTIKQQKIQLKTLDYFLGQRDMTQTISLIKIDSQGFDLHILRGAKQTLQRHQPWLIVELIYVPLYEGQSQPHEIFTWLAAHNYTLAGVFNIHYSSDGWIAFADGVFVPTPSASSFKGAFLYTTIPSTTFC